MSLIQPVNPSVSALPIGIYTSRPEAFLVNSYLVDTNAGIVVIDSQFLISEARELKDKINSTGKPLAAIFITHPHPDHFNGVGVLVEDAPNVPIYATQPTLNGIIAVEAQKRAFWTPIHGANYPVSTVLPNNILSSGKSVTIGGVTFCVEDIGEGETSNMTLIYVPAKNVLFAGDLAYHSVHPWLVESHSQAWLQQLAAVQQRYSTIQTVYVGHGAPGAMTMFAEQIDYITFFQALVRQYQSASGVMPDEASSNAIIKATIERYPGLPLESLIAMNIAGIVAEHIA